jgi:hypothetical protein
MQHKISCQRSFVFCQYQTNKTEIVATKATQSKLITQFCLPSTANQETNVATKATHHKLPPLSFLPANQQKVNKEKIVAIKATPINCQRRGVTFNSKLTKEFLVTKATKQTTNAVLFASNSNTTKEKQTKRKLLPPKQHKIYCQLSFVCNQ